MSDSRKPGTESAEAGLSRQIAFEDIPPEGIRVRLRGDVDDRNALVARLAVLAVDEVEAEFEIFRIADDEHLIGVEGRVAAALSQSCVVTLEPLPVRIDSAVSIRFTDLDDGADDNWESDADDEDPPELATDGIIDLGDLVAQQLALEIDPFPRGDGVPFVDVSAGDESESGAAKPFAGLAVLRDKLKD